MTIRTLLSVILLLFSSLSLMAAERPNILWISCEDISPQLGCYGDAQAMTPHLDQLASEGTLFTHAFSCHGVCAPSRTGIITGMSPISLGANHMRSKASLPEHVRLLPQYLRDAGYYCTNNSKTDYNLNWNEKATWNDSSNRAHWKNRPSADVPFFAVFNLTMTHESKVWPDGWKDVVKELPNDKRHRAENMIVPPLYPDTPEIRADLARLADLITVMDRKAGQLLQEIHDAGLADNTIVMFWSDHGNGLPRFKRFTYDSGSRVPLIVRAPEKLRAHAGLSGRGSKDDRMINLMDLAPTVLRLAGIQPPEHMQGIPFLGPDKGRERKFIHGARDRIDERFDMVRTVRSRTHRYVRNLMPWRPTLQHVVYGEQNETMKELRRLAKSGDLPAESSQWFTSPRAAEELYDLESDPWELVNLAGSPAHQATLKALSDECDRWQIEARDAHLLPEILLDQEERKSGSRWAILNSGDGVADGQQRTTRLLHAAKEAATLSETAATFTLQNLENDPAIRWWQVSRLAHAPRPELRVEVLAQEASSDEPAIRIAAAVGLAKCGRSEAAADILRNVMQSESVFVRHAAALAIDEAGPSVIRLAKDSLPVDSKDEYVRRLTEHALSQLVSQ